MTENGNTTNPALDQIDALIGEDNELFDDLLLVLAGDAAEVTSDAGKEIAAIVATMTPEQITELCTHYALCPVHAGDLEICEDDDDPECRNYRANRG
jgi:predicted hydrocarbon binding protein